MAIQYEIEPEDRSGLIALAPFMRAFARSLYHDRAPADDLALAALASAWRRREFRGPNANLKAMAFTLLREQVYRAKDRAGAASRRPRSTAEVSLVRRNPCAAPDLDDVRQALRSLPDVEKEALALIVMAGMKYRDAAAISGCAEGTLRRRARRAQQALIAILEDNWRLPESKTERPIANDQWIALGCLSLSHL